MLLVLEGALRDVQIIAKSRLRNPSLRRHATHRSERRCVTT